MSIDGFCTTVFLIGGLLTGLMAGIFLGRASTEHQTVSNTVANGVVNNTANVVTETEVYKVVCVAPADGYCKDYSVRKINRE